MQLTCPLTVLVPTSPPGVMSKRKEHPLLERVADEGNCKFARALGSVDYHTREKGLQALTLWLSRKPNIGELEMLKLWRGLFYCFWHSDKQPVQTALAERLSELMLQLPEQVALLYYAASLKTLRREWFGIDHLRLNKFLMLVRKFFNQALRLLQASNWSAEQAQLFTDLWLHEVLLPQDNRAAAGLAYHICDLLLPELAAVCSGSSSDGASAAPQQSTLRALLEPFCQALARSRDPALVYRLRQGVFDPLVKGVADVDASWLDPLDAAALAAHLFDLGAQQETRAKSREALYAISTALESSGKQRQRHQQQQAGASGVAHTGPEQPQTLANGGQQQRAKKKKKKRSAEEAGMAVATPGPAAPPSNGEQGRAVPIATVAHEPVATTPATVSKPKKKKAKVAPASAGHDLAQQAAAEEKGASLNGQHHEQELAEQHAAEEQQQPLVSAKKKKKKVVVAATAAAEPGGGEGSTPAAAVRSRGAAAAAGPPTTGGKKNVRFSLRKNLVMTIGQPPLPEDVRTPPTSKPKGPALKVTSSIKAAPGSAPGRLNHAVRQRSKLGHQQQQGSKSASKAPAGRSAAGQSQAGAGARRALTLVSPQSLPRAKAAEFF